MPGTSFRHAIIEATGRDWETWVKQLQQDANPSWSHEQLQSHLAAQAGVDEEWSEWIALMYGQLLGRVPVGVTKDAGVQIGVRRTVAAAKEKVWHFLTSPQGVQLWIGETAPFEWEVGQTFGSLEGASGKLTVVMPFQKLRMSWQRGDWEKPSRLQIYLLTTNTGKTTIALHQEMLEDVYMREVMRKFWVGIIDEIEHALLQD